MLLVTASFQQRVMRQEEHWPRRWESWVRPKSQHSVAGYLGPVALKAGSAPYLLCNLRHFASLKSWGISCEMNIIPTSEDCREDGIKVSVWGLDTNWCSVNGRVAAKGLVVGMNRGRFQLSDLESGETGLCN